MSDKAASWSAGSLGFEHGFVRHHPSEVMMRALFSRRYCSLAPERIGEGTRVLDIGAMYLNNLAPFLDRGCACFGVEVNEAMVEVARKAATAQGMHGIDLRVGRNRELPFEDGGFDILLSVNVIHYEDDAEGLQAAFAEYRRVLAPGGRAFVVSAGPRHHLRASAERLCANRYRIAAEDDFRKGQVMAYFEDEADLGALAATAFGAVATGRVTERHDRAEVDFLYAVCGR